MAVAQILLGISRLAQSTAPVRTFLPHSLWVLILFVFTFLVWWATWEFRDLEWTFAHYAFILLPPTLLFLASSLIMPQRLGEGEVDLEAHFLRVRRPLMWSFLLFTATVILDGPLLGTEELIRPVRIAHSTWFLGAVWGIWAEDRRSHAAIATIVIITLLVVTATRFWRVAG
jgi:hypothetical protein